MSGKLLAELMNDSTPGINPYYLFSSLLYCVMAAALRLRATDIKYVARAFATSIILMMILSLGALAPMDGDEASAIGERLSAHLGGRSEPLELAAKILSNNLMIALIGIMPAIGPPFLFNAVYESGRFLGRLAIAAGLPPDAIPMTIFIASLSSPSIQLEFLGYSIAALESINLMVRLVVCAVRGRKPGLEVLRRLARSIITVSILLTAAALLEAIMLARARV